MKVNRVFSILIPMILSLILIFAIVYFLSRQVSDFLDDSDKIQERLDALYWSLQHWVRSEFGVTITKQNQVIYDTGQKMNAADIVGRTFLSLTSILSYLVFLPIYTFLILYYKDLIKQFLIAAFHNSYEANVREILFESRAISQKYIVGLVTDMAIVCAMYAAGFLMFGIKYALFLALVAAILNLLPYIGMIIANLFCMLITLVSSENMTDVFWVGMIILVGHLIDNNFLLPRIVGSKVKINALVTLLGVLVGGAICGVPGMFLSVPALAVLKVIFDRVDSLKPYGLILGGETNGSSDKPMKIEPIKPQ
jgi:predicted PurR-regulated permease PerM